jgi:methylated-DNA-[protein]-cysteine S-methyltransferase
MNLTAARVVSPVVVIDLFVGDGTLWALGFAGQTPELRARLRARGASFDGDPARAAPIATRVRAYLDGDLDALDDVAVEPGGTPFQRRVWRALREIPVGQTRSYAELARAIGQPSAVRAVARANARNPISLVIPCHRVIGADGALCGYAGGVERKRWLLEHEASTGLHAGRRGARRDSRSASAERDR